MRNLELLSLAWRNLKRRKSRTALTVLSMVIGAVAIILMLSFGYAIKESQRKQMEAFAQMNVIRVYPMSSSGMEDGERNSDQGSLTDKQIRKIEKISHVKAVLPSQNVYFSVMLENKEKYSLGAELHAIDFDTLPPDSIEMEEGSIPTKTKDDPFLVGASTKVYKQSGRNNEMTEVEDFDWKKEPLVIPYDWGQEEGTITLGKTKRKSIPIKFAGRFSSSDLLDSFAIYISFDTLDKLEAERQKIEAANPEQMQSYPTSSSHSGTKRNLRVYDEAIVALDDMQYTDAILQTITEDMGLIAYSNLDTIESLNQDMLIVQLIFAGIGSISLIVSAIGIANTMLMSIHERMREIGVMKVIGAQVSDIRRMFLIESALIGVLGGMTGILVSYLLSAGLNAIAGSYLVSQGFMDASYISIIPFWLPFAAFLFSAIIGIIAGYLPANRATKISAIEAIRTE